MKKIHTKEILKKVIDSFNKVSKKKIILSENKDFKKIFDSLDLFNLSTVLEETMGKYINNFSIDPIEISKKYKNLKLLEKYIEKCLKK